MKNPVEQLLDAGQSVWLDNVRRSMFASGELARLIEIGLRGMTSNPTIFEKAIGAGTDYDEQLAQLVGTEKSADALFWISQSKIFRARAMRLPRSTPLRAETTASLASRFRRCSRAIPRGRSGWWKSFGNASIARTS